MITLNSTAKATVLFALFISFALVLTTLSQAAIVTQPSGLTAGDQYRLVFVTSTETYSGGSNHGANPPWFTTAADYNAFGTTAATAVTELNDLGTTWTAIVSTRDELPGNPTVDARDNTFTNPGSGIGVPIYNLGGLIVANNNADLWDGTIANPINVTELGTGPTAQHGGLFRVWTGTNENGTNAGGQRLIWQDGGWISNGLADATSHPGGNGWVRGNFDNAIHTHDQPIYVMSGILAAPGTPPPPTDDALVYESMSHAINPAGGLHGMTPDAGAASPWSINTGAGTGQIIAPSATYTDGNTNVLPVAGNRFETVAGNNDFGGFGIDTSLWSAGNTSGGKLNTAGAEIWFSVLMQSQGAGSNQFWLELSDSTGGGVFRVGDKFFNSNWMIEGTNDDGTLFDATSSNNASDDVDFLVGRLTTDGSNNTTFDLWIDPLLDTEPGAVGTGDLSVTVAANGDGSVTQFDRIGYRHQKWESPNLLDEIRMGETFNSVVGAADVVPEPSTCALLGVGLLGLMLHRRRRKR